MNAINFQEGQRVTLEATKGIFIVRSHFVVGKFCSMTWLLSPAGEVVCEMTSRIHKVD